MQFFLLLKTKKKTTNHIAILANVYNMRSLSILSAITIRKTALLTLEVNILPRRGGRRCNLYEPKACVVIVIFEDIINCIYLFST